MADKMADKADNRPQRPNWLVRRGSLLVYLIVVLAILVGVNVLASRHDRSWDLTKGQQNSLSNESVKVLKGLQQPLHLLYFDRSANFASARTFLSRYQRVSRLVDVQFIDPDRHPDQARQYKIQSYGTTVVQSGSQQQTVATLAEQDLTNAIVRVLKGGRKVIYFTQGEGELDPSDTGRNGYSDLKTALESENFTVEKLVLAQSPKIPADCAVLIVAGPTHALVAPEVQAIQDYINQGGRVLFMLTPVTAGPLVDYLQTSLNVKLTPDVVVDTSGIGRLFGASELMPIAATYDPHPITAQMNQEATLFPYTRTVEAEAAPTASTSKAVVSPLVETTPQSLASTSFTGGKVAVDASDRHGPLTLGVAGTLAVSPAAAAPATAAANSPDSTEARYVVYGSPDFVSNSILGFNGNRDLFLNSLDWLASQQDFISIRPKTAANTPVNLSAAQMRWVLIIFLGGLPLIVVIIGCGIWWRRRAL